MAFHVRMFFLVAAALVVFSSTLQAQSLRFHHWLSPVHPIVTETLKPWFDDIKRVTEGRVTVEYAAAPLAPPPAQFELVRDGVVDMALSVHGFTPGRFILPSVAELPFLSYDSRPLSVALYRTYEKFFAKADEHKGIVVLSMWATKPGHPWSTSKALTSIDDFKGLKIAGANSINVDIAKALDAVPVQAPPSRTYELLQRGIVDAAFVDHSSYKDFNLGPFLKHTTRFEKGLYAGTLFVMINPAAWNRLTEADRKAILSVSGEKLSSGAGRNWDKAALDAEQIMKSNGVNVVKPDVAMTAGVRERLAFLEARWIESVKKLGVDGTEALKFLREQIAAEEPAQ